MKYAKTITISFVIFSAVILSATVGTVKSICATASEWSSIQLTTDANRHLQPTLSADRIVWLGADGLKYQVYTQKMNGDSSPTLVSTGPAADCDVPKVSGVRIAWQAESGGENNIYTRKMGTDDLPELVSIDAATYNIYPVISGDRIAWYGSTELYTRKMGAGSTSTLVSNNSPGNDSVRISGDRIVWSEYTGTTNHIFTMKIGVDTSPKQLTFTGDNLSPVVSGDRVAWVGKVDGYWQIFTEKIGTDTNPKQVTTLPFNCDVVQVSGDRIVWTDIGLRVFTMKMGVDTTPIQLSSGLANSPDVSGNRVIWWESVSGTYQLIVKDVGSNDPPVQLSEGGGNQAMVSGEYVTWIGSVEGINQVFVAHAPLPVVIQYTVTFNSQGGSTVGSIKADYNATITAPTAPTRTGYTFGGWYKESACTNAWNFTIDKVTAATTLYAKWVPNTYTVKFNTNGGAGTMPSLVVTYNATKTLTANTFKKTGYSFLGWATTTTGAVVYKDKASVKNLTAVNKGTVTLYAKWGVPITSAASYTYSSIKVSWTYAGSATLYKVYRATSATGTYSLVYTAASTARSWTNTGLVTGKTYYYKVYPVAVGKAYTNSTYKYAKPIPSTPTTTLTKYSSKSIKVTWAGVSGATKYQIYRATSSTGTYSLVNTATSTARSWVNTGRTVGGTYYYKVRAYHLEGTTKVYGAFSTVKYLKL